MRSAVGGDERRAVRSASRARRSSREELTRRRDRILHRLGEIDGRHAPFGASDSIFERSRIWLMRRVSRSDS